MIVSKSIGDNKANGLQVVSSADLDYQRSERHCQHHDCCRRWNPDRGHDLQQHRRAAIICHHHNDAERTFDHQDVDLAGGLAVDRRTTDATTLGADGSRTRVVAYEFDGAAEGKSTTHTTWDGLKTTTTWEGLGQGVTRSREETTTLNADGSVTQLVEHKGPAAGALLDKTITTTNALGTSKTTTFDRDGNLTTDATVVQERMGDGTVATAYMEGAVSSAAGRQFGTVSGKYVSQTGNGLSTTTRYDSNGNGLAELETTDVTVLNANGGSIRTITRSGLTGGDAASANPTYTATLKDQAVVSSNASG